MSTVIDTLISDRSQADVSRLITQKNKILKDGWDSLSEEERTEWLSGMRGAYNYVDLNRVTEAIKYLNERLSTFGYTVEYAPLLIHHKVAVYATDEAGNVIMAPEEIEDEFTGETYTIMSAVFDHWDEWTDEIWIKEDTPNPSQMKQYLDNVQRVRAVMELPAATPAVPGDMDRLTVEEANDIERILLDIEKNINQVAGAFRRSNAPSFWSGSEPLPTAQSDLGRTWEELDAMGTTWANWQAADWYLLLYGNLKAEGDVDDGV